MVSEDLPSTRAEAKLLGVKYYFTGKPCKHGHIVKRYMNGCCCECQRIRMLNYSRSNPEENRARAAAFYKEHPEKSLAYTKQRYADNPEKFREYSKQWYANNKEKLLEYAKRYYKDNTEQMIANAQNWQKLNPAKVNANANKRRAQKLSAIPKWETPGDIAHIKWLYKQANLLTKSTGIVFHLDHIYPLQGETMCGLHTPSNLQIITQNENNQKFNKNPEDFYYK